MRIRRSRLARLCGASLALAGLGCAGAGLRLDEIPEARIAISYLEPEAARRAQQRALEERERRGGGPLAPRGAEPAPRLDVLERYVERALGAAPRDPRARAAADPRGGDEESPRLALLEPRSGRIELVEQALRGSRPLAWSADRERLLFSQVARGSSQLFELELASGAVRQLTREPRVHPGGCYGPEGRIVVAVIEATRESLRQYLGWIPAQGGSAEPLTEGPSDRRPACAPDGSALAFVREGPRGRSEIAVAAPIGGEVRTLGPGTDPRFAADASTLIYSAPGKRVFSAGQFHELWQLWRVRLDGSGRFALGQAALDELAPSFSPDGRLVVYVGVDAALGRALYLRRADGSGDRLLFDRGDALTPVW